MCTEMRPLRTCSNVKFCWLGVIDGVESPLMGGPLWVLKIMSIDKHGSHKPLSLPTDGQLSKSPSLSRGHDYVLPRDPWLEKVWT
ncbi:hypothetical protein B0T26DRAFT_714109 [Lasiosphaeria miniovina]|uniref:Uncharacterized protein n=1 Tax=Lasiosphaeria miniovina TaxID=1954250 RepID=A0AA40AAM4_9PEZI|nr:uncharacterized protein B0T26DRAFT_714109 [Lasiosphaeria miniovina]KAK0712377.1 hypothetical protein B0T26DRAFT_714109 [Lasiosphaeria miniovina]